MQHIELKSKASGACFRDLAYFSLINKIIGINIENTEAGNINIKPYFFIYSPEGQLMFIYFNIITSPNADFD